MKKTILIILVWGAFLYGGQGVWADDFFVVVAGRGSVGTKIISLPYTIINPGFYYLGRDLAYSGAGNAITIEANDVTLDLMGFSLTHTGPSPGVYPYGIYMLGRKNVEIRNGTISGFYIGIAENHWNDGANHRVINIRATNNNVENMGVGIALVGKNHLVRDCTAANNGSAGIALISGTITGCLAHDNKIGIALEGDGSLLDNVATNTNPADTIGFKLGYLDKTLVDGNSASGNGSNYDGGDADTTWGVNAGR